MFFRNRSHIKFASARRAMMMLSDREDTRPDRAKNRLEAFCSTGCAVTAFSRTGLERATPVLHAEG
jgi:hypothetical protein